MPVKTSKEVDRLVSLEDVRRAIDKKPHALWYDTDKQEQMAIRLGFSLQEWSDVFFHIKTLRHEGRLQRTYKDLAKPRHHRRGSKLQPVRRVVFKKTKQWSPEKPPLPIVVERPPRSSGHFVRW